MNMGINSSAIKGGIIGAVANGIANYITFGSLQPINIIVGIVVGCLIGVLMKL